MQGDVTPYALRVSQELSDLDWDRFVEATHGGAYQQSSRWAQVKSTVDWRCIGLILFRDNQIVAGCQALVRSFARVNSGGSLGVGAEEGYTPRGVSGEGPMDWIDDGRAAGARRSRAKIARELRTGGDNACL